MKKTFVIISVLFFYSCASNTDIETIINDYCNCCKNILEAEKNRTTKKIKLENCALNYINSIDKLELNSLYKPFFIGRLEKKMKNNCSECADFEELYKEKRIITENLTNQPHRCKEYFIDGRYRPIGIEENIVIIRKDSNNIVEYLDLGYTSKFTVKWVSDCSYYLIMKETTRPDITTMIGDSMLVRIINISNDTIDYEVDIDDWTYPQKMRKIN